MHKDNGLLSQLIYTSQGWQAWDCCSENRNEQSRTGEWETCGSSVLLCLFPALLVLGHLGVKYSFPGSVSAAVPDQELQWYNPTSPFCSSHPYPSCEWAGAGICSSVVVGYPKYLSIQLCHQNMCTQMLSPVLLGFKRPQAQLCSLQVFIRIWEYQMPSCWYSMRLFPGHNQWAGGQS